MILTPKSVYEWSGVISFLGQFSGGPTVFSDRINALLAAPNLKRVRAAVAYARWDGLGLLAPRLEGFLQSGGELQTVYGIANGVTTPDSLLYGLYLQALYPTHTYCGAVEDEYANATFHPKFIEFRFTDRIAVIVGSANLTGGGLTRNTEVGFEVEAPRGEALEKKLAESWRSIRGMAQLVSLELIRGLNTKRRLGSEEDRSEGFEGKAGKPYLQTGMQTSPKPLFAKVLEIPVVTKKTQLLAKLDPLTEKPQRLYLQLLAGETGGSAGRSGYQIQLPVATLRTFFGAGPNQAKQASFRFGGRTFTVTLTHFSNDTHRVRLLPLRDVPKPAIVVFERRGPDRYRCEVVPAKDYPRVLAQKCNQQTRAGARRWGLE